MTEALRLSRVVPATREAVWLAWTTEAGLARWWWHTWPDTRYRVDARPGGTYRIEAADHGMGVHGTFVRLERPHRLVFSWIWYDLVDGAEVGQPADEVEVIFSDAPHGIRVELTHRGAWGAEPEAAENYRQGWAFVLDALEAHSPG